MKILFALLLLPALAFADNWRHHTMPQTIEAPTVTVPLVLEVDQVSNVTEVSAYNKCQGVAFAQAAANNQMHLGTHKPQVSIGVGECDGDVAGSLMFGMKPCNNCPMLNGSWGFDERVNAFGLGATFIFK